MINVDSFSEIDPSFTAKVAENGWILEVSGRDHDNQWVERTYVFREETLFFSAISKIGQAA